jgi:hypothetical protein
MVLYEYIGSCCLLLLSKRDSIFPVPTQKRGENSEAGLIVVRAKCGQRLKEREISKRLGLGSSSNEGLQTKQSLSTPTCAESSYRMYLGGYTTHSLTWRLRSSDKMDQNHTEKVAKLRITRIADPSNIIIQ